MGTTLVAAPPGPGIDSELAPANRAAAFVIPHPYIDALPCFREPVKRLAGDGWQIDLYTTLSPMHPAPSFGRENVRLVPIEQTRSGLVRLVDRLVRHRPKYAWIFTVPQWALHYVALAASIVSIPVACISDELKAGAEAVSSEQKRWKERERRAHRKCAMTIAFSEPRAAFIREENQLAQDHPILVVPNAQPGAARRLASRYYQDTLDIPADRCVLLHAGGWWWKRRFPGLEEAATRWNGRLVLVFQGRTPNPLEAPPVHANIRVSPFVLSPDLVNYAASSARIGLALYDTHIANDRLMSTASGKVMLYMRNALPVIVNVNPSFDWIEREGCGVCVSDLNDIASAADLICSDYGRYVANVKRCYDTRFDFNLTFRPVLEQLNQARGADGHVQTG